MNDDCLAHDGDRLVPEHCVEGQRQGDGRDAVVAGNNVAKVAVVLAHIGRAAVVNLKKAY